MSSWKEKYLDFEIGYYWESLEGRKTPKFLCLMEYLFYEGFYYFRFKLVKEEHHEDTGRNN